MTALILRQGSAPPAEAASPAAKADSGADAQRPAFVATESVMQQRTYFGGVMVAYVLGLAVAFTVRSWSVTSTQPSH